MLSLRTLPPIDVYKLGDVYFVRDGNHRVSVAKANGAREIPYEELPWLHDMVAGLAQRAGIPKPRLYVSPQPAPNASAMHWW